MNARRSGSIGRGIGAAIAIVFLVVASTALAQGESPYRVRRDFSAPDSQVWQAWTLRDDLDGAIRGLSSIDPGAVAEATKVLMQAGRDGFLTLVHSMKGEDPYPDLGYPARRLLHESRTEALPAMRIGLSHPDFVVRANCAQLIGRLGPDAADALNDLLSALDDPNSFVRESVVTALAAIGRADPPIGEHLQRSLQDWDTFVRAESARAIDRLRTPEPVPQLFVNLRRDVEASVREPAGRALAHFGNPAEEVARSLVDATADPSRRVARQATALLVQRAREDMDFLAGLVGCLAEGRETETVLKVLRNATGRTLGSVEEWNAYINEVQRGVQ